MPSLAFQNLETAAGEIPDLLAAAAPAAGSLKERAARARVIGRASIVLLSSHFERYFRASNEEAVAFVTGVGLRGDRVPELIRLAHSRTSIDELERTSWENRAGALRAFVSDEAWLWSIGASGSLKSARLLDWMKSPMPEHLKRYYRAWGITDIFAAITRKPQTRFRYVLLVRELVDKRNNIAHGDFSAQATRLDVRRYITTVLGFCERVDRTFGRQLGRIAGVQQPW